MDKKTVDQLQKRIIELKQNRPDLQHALGLYSSVVEAAAGIDPAVSGEPFDISAAAAKGPYPFFDLARADIKWSACAPVFRRMCEVFCEQGPAESDVERAKDLAEDEAGLMLAKAFKRLVLIDRGVMPENPEAVSDQLSFVAFLTMRNYMGHLVGEGRKLLDNRNGVYEATCPVCGGRPIMSRLIEKEGLRLLICGICESNWLYPRLKCHNCGNTSHKTIGLIMPENTGDLYSIFTCEECMHYQKILDNRNYPEGPDALFEAISSAHWDYIAQKRGFKTSSTWMGMMYSF